MINFKVDKEMLQFFENNMNKAKEQRDKFDNKDSMYPYYQGALDEARNIYFELFAKHVEENFMKTKKYSIN